MTNMNRFDVIIIGGGHAGIEAALAAARIGVKTLLLTHNLDTIGQMSCNPSIGGIGKGHLVKEIDALGGIMAAAADRAGIHFRTLNASKGPAVRATRAQTDRILYKQAIREFLEQQKNLSILQQTADRLIIEKDKVQGIITHLDQAFYAPAVAIAAGTFLNGKIHIGLKNYSGGRAGDPAAIALAKFLRSLGLRGGRLKTGTPPRIAGSSIDYSKLIEQKGDEPTPSFSFYKDISVHPRQISCHIARTNDYTHEIIRKNLDRSPLFTGCIEGTGPRYCPSIEDKVVRFSDRTSHQIFLEPEGLQTDEVYPNGISTSLPFEVQIELVKTISGLENSRIIRPGYAIEYDFFDPRDLNPSMETKQIKGLFFAGQINGTTGYEEAAAQGLIAGINAALKAQNKEPWWPRRDEGYIGVMIDDLIIRGITEPYRMFTSRAEYRLILREDNADLRLTEIGRKLGLISDQHWEMFIEKKHAVESHRVRLNAIRIKPNTPDAEKIEKLTGQKLEREFTFEEMLRRPELSYEKLTDLESFSGLKTPKTVCEQVEIQVKYAGYIKQQQDEIERHRKHEELHLPDAIDYDEVPSLSNEVRYKLKQVRPVTLGQAARISGMTPAAISILLVYLKKNKLA